MFGDRPAAQRPSSAHAWNPNVCVLGKLPSRPDFVHYGLHEEPERVFRTWLEHAVLIAGGVLPNRAVRFIAAPRRTPVFGVWIPSQDSLGRAFPLVLIRRLVKSDTGLRRTQGEPRALGDLPWTLLLAGCSHYLTAAESCLMWGRASPIADLWSQLETLSLPSRRDLTELWAESKRALDFERLDVFAQRNLSDAADGDAFVSAVRRLRSGDRSASQDAAMLALPAENELDLFAWLELLRVQRPPEATPRAMFWSPADKRALVSLGAPLPGTLAFLRQPRLKSVHRFPVTHEPDESPAVEAELRCLMRMHPTLGTLRTALSPTREEDAQATTAVTPAIERATPAAALPALPGNSAEEEVAPATSGETQQAGACDVPPADLSAHPTAAGGMNRGHRATNATPRANVGNARGFEHRAAQVRPSTAEQYEPPPIYKFRCVSAPDSHFTPEELRRFELIDRAMQCDAPTEAAPVQASAPERARPRTDGVPQTQPLSGDFVPEKQSRTERIEGAAEQARPHLRFRIPDPPINLSDTDAIEYVCAMVRERDRAHAELQERQQGHDGLQERRGEPERDRARSNDEPIHERERRQHERRQRERYYEAAPHPALDASVRVLQPITIADQPKREGRASGQRMIEERRERETDPAPDQPDVPPSELDRAHHSHCAHERKLAIARLELEVRSRDIALHEAALQRRELELARQEHALRRRVHAVLRHAPLADTPTREPRAAAHPHQHPHLQQPAIARAPATACDPCPEYPPSASDPDTTCVRILEPITLVDDGSISAARVLMIDSPLDRPSASRDRTRSHRIHRPASRPPRSLASC